MRLPKEQRKPEKEIYYTGDPGSVSGQKGHTEDDYRDIAKQIMAQIVDKDGAKETWPEEVQVSVVSGKKQVQKPWTQRSEEEFRKGFF